MKFSAFLEKFDRPGVVVLLEGKRNVRPADAPLLTAVAKKLAEASRHIMFRSGNASGSDYFFTQGITSVAAQRMQVITPYTGHRKQHNYAAETVSLDEINLAAEPEVVYQSKANKRMKNLVEQYVSGHVDQHSIKAAYIIRDTVKVLGTEKIRPADFALFYDDLEHPGMGGTGHTMQVCIQNGVPCFNQTTFFSWLDEAEATILDVPPRPLDVPDVLLD